MRHCIFGVAFLAAVSVLAVTPPAPCHHAADTPLLVGFAAEDVTPAIKPDKPVYLAGFGNNRKATGVHDPLMARTIVLSHGEQKIALVAIDVIGFFNPNVDNVRKRLQGFTYVLVSSTHNHEGPDTLGLWGPTNPLPKSGVDPEYLSLLEDKIVASVNAAVKNQVPCHAKIGKANLPELLHDGRQPIVKHDELVALTFETMGGQRHGMVVQWNCHPETLADKNTLISADYVGYTVSKLQKDLGCPVVYFTGTVGGLMTSLHVPIKNDKGVELADGTYEKTELFGMRVAEGALHAIAGSQPVSLTPLVVKSKKVFVPMENKLYHAARWMGILNRQAFFWKGDPDRCEPAPNDARDQPLAIQTEVGILQMGELGIAAFPGEVYPELVLDKIQDPADPGADFPDAPKEPAIYPQLKQKHRMIIGLANDEVGYVLPKRQWDEKPPFCYGLPKAQYGEQNSLGPDAAPIICRAIQQLAR